MEIFNPKSFFFSLTAPSITFLFGGTNSGKTHLMGQILSQFRQLFASNVQVANVVLVYSFYQPYYNLYFDAIKTFFPKVKIQVFKGLTSENVAELKKSELWHLKGANDYTIFILDDVASSISKDLDAFWEGRCHHERISKLKLRHIQSMCNFFLHLQFALYWLNNTAPT